VLSSNKLPSLGRMGSMSFKKSGIQRRARAFYRHQVLDYLNPSMQAFVTKQEMMFVGTADRHGEADTSFRADWLASFACLTRKLLRILSTEVTQ
jgi:hypothetical protein